MKRKKLFILLGLEFAALSALALLLSESPRLFSSLLAFPFEQIGVGLQALSRSGRLGNGLALALWVGISLLPLLPVWRCRRADRRAAENFTLYFLSALLLFVLSGMADPLLLSPVFPRGGDQLLPVAKAVLGGAIWSVAVLWAVLRLLRLFYAGDTPLLLSYLRTLLHVLCALFVGAIALSAGGELIATLPELPGELDRALAALRFLVTALPYGLDIAITLAALDLLDELLSADAGNAGAGAERLARLCGRSLALTCAAIALFNVLQLALAHRLSQIATTVNIPIMSIAFVLATLLAARLITENQRLRHDNDLFI